MLVIAHRGSSQKAPENTLPAIKKAVRDGADMIEIDVQLTKDQRVVVIHDEWLHRTTNGEGFVFQTPLETIKKLDAGSWFNPRYKGTQVPTLEEVLDFVKDHAIQLQIELKNSLIPYPGLEEKVIQLIKLYNLEDRVILSSFRQNSLLLCKQLAPEIRRGLLCWSATESIYHQEKWSRLELYSIHPNILLLHSKFASFQEKGYKIFPYVIERKRELQKCIQLNMDGVFTNSPSIVKKILSSKRKEN